MRTSRERDAVSACSGFRREDEFIASSGDSGRLPERPGIPDGLGRMQ